MGKEGDMPKEYTDCTVSDCRAEVSWSHVSAGGHVQLATVNPSIEETDESGARGWYVTLDRDQINRIIRHLRTARDAAFGRDA